MRCGRRRDGSAPTSCRSSRCSGQCCPPAGSSRRRLRTALGTRRASTPLALPPAIAPVEPVPVVAAPADARAGGGAPSWRSIRQRSDRRPLSRPALARGGRAALGTRRASTPLGWPPATVPVAPSAVVPLVVSAAWAGRRGSAARRRSDHILDLRQPGLQSASAGLAKMPSAITAAEYFRSFIMDPP